MTAALFTLGFLLALSVTLNVALWSLNPRYEADEVVHKPIPETVLDAEDMPLVASDEFAVGGTPKHVPWKYRKAQLEEASRTKRRQRESFREEA